LVKNGWTNEVIDDGFEEVEGKNESGEVKEANKNISEENVIDKEFNKDIEKGKIILKKETISVTIEEEIMNVLKKRAKKNLLSVEAMAEDIIRRSCVTFKNNPSSTPEKLDDLLVAIFSRKNTGKRN
jgi:hypothetical protein